MSSFMPGPGHFLETIPMCCAPRGTRSGARRGIIISIWIKMAGGSNRIVPGPHGCCGRTRSGTPTRSNVMGARAYRWALERGHCCCTCLPPKLISDRLFYGGLYWQDQPEPRANDGASCARPV
uniref:Uncharacterized protein n=1 Tax=Arundo donax TaxID=35708 RepID=A0A0A9B9Z2_ARUDO